MNFDRKIFFTKFREAFGSLNQGQVDGLQSLLRNLEADIHVTDIRQAAYMLATVKHECADTWKPIQEYGKGAGRKYGEPVKVISPSGEVLERVYYGRGYVQLTWENNYLKMDELLGLSGDSSLHLYPENALNPDIAYKVMSKGMREGSFTGRSLEDFICGKVCDYFKARKIINGTDRAVTIQGYAHQLEGVLKSSLKN